MVSPLPSLVSLQTAKEAVNITYNSSDADLQLRLELAHEIVLDYLDNQIDDDDDVWLETILAWTEDNAPRRVKGAILHLFVHLVRFRGDDIEKDVPELVNGMPAHLRLMLDRLRDPTVA